MNVIRLFEAKLPTAERGQSLIAIQQLMSSALCVNKVPTTSENVASSVVCQKCMMSGFRAQLHTVEPVQDNCLSYYVSCDITGDVFIETAVDSAFQKEPDLII
jgi:hypothetical protein